MLLLFVFLLFLFKKLSYLYSAACLFCSSNQMTKRYSCFCVFYAFYMAFDLCSVDSLVLDKVRILIGFIVLSL